MHYPVIWDYILTACLLQAEVQLIKPMKDTEAEMPETMGYTGLIPNGSSNFIKSLKAKKHGSLPIRRRLDTEE